MKGFLKMNAADFEAWNAAATGTHNQETGDDTCASYSSYKEDVDPAFVWARVEHDFVEGDIKTKEEALQLGMVIPENDLAV